MTIDVALFARLTAVTAVTDLVSTRIWPDTVPEPTVFPAVRYMVVSVTRESVMGQDTGDARARVQFTCLDATYDGAVAIRTAIRGALQRFRGTVGGVLIQDVFIENELNGYDNEAEQFAPSLDALIWYKEP